MILIQIIIVMTFSIIGLLCTLSAVIRNIAPFFRLIGNCLQAGRDQKMMFEWAGKNQAWCSKNQFDLEALARRVKALEESLPPASKKGGGE